MNTSGPISKEAAEEFSERLMSWWREVARQFRWRRTKDLYELLVAELLLRRTNARAVEQVYDVFLEKYPDKISLSNGKPGDLRQLLKPLGLAWRAENMVSLSKHLKKTGCNIPEDLSELQTLPGVGPYVARAVLVNYCDLRMVPIDSNVVRVLSRFLGIAENDNLRRSKRFQQIADSFLGSAPPRSFNYALLDLAASVCRPQKPKCAICPLAMNCKSAEVPD